MQPRLGQQDHAAQLLAEVEAEWFRVRVEPLLRAETLSQRHMIDAASPVGSPCVRLLGTLVLAELWRQEMAERRAAPFFYGADPLIRLG